MDRPANRRKFAVIKRQERADMNPEIKKLVEQLLGRELTDEEVSKSSITEEQASEVKQNLDVLVRYRDDLPAVVLKAIAEMSCRALLSKSEQADEKPEDKVTLDDVIDKAIEKVGAKFTKDMMEALNKLVQQVEALAQAIKPTVPDVAKADDKKATEIEPTAELVKKLVEEKVKQIRGR